MKQEKSSINNYRKSSEGSNSKKKDFFLTKDVGVCLDIKLKERVKILLLRLGKSQNWLADEIGINKGTLSQIVNGFWIPTSQIKIRMGEVLGVDSLVLFGGYNYWKDYTNKIGYEREKNG